MAVAGCQSNPSPIKDLVKRTFLEFKKTHMDGWEVFREMFDGDELAVLADLVVSPSYYA